MICWEFFHSFYSFNRVGGVQTFLEKTKPFRIFETSQIGKISFSNIVFDDIIISNSSTNFKRVCWCVTRFSEFGLLPDGLCLCIGTHTCRNPPEQLAWLTQWRQVSLSSCEAAKNSLLFANGSVSLVGSKNFCDKKQRQKILKLNLQLVGVLLILNVKQRLFK